jgi:hypothetical protein
MARWRPLEIQLKRDLRKASFVQINEFEGAIITVEEKIRVLREKLTLMYEVHLNSREELTYIWYKKKLKILVDVLALMYEKIAEVRKIAKPLSKSVFRLKKCNVDGQIIWMLDVRYF